MDEAPRPARSRALTWGLPAAALVVAAIAVAAVWIGGSDRDGGPGAGDGVSRSSTIAWADSGRSLWVTSPDDDRVVEVDPGSLEVRQQVEVGGQPRELTVLGDRLVVTGAQSTDVAIVDVGRGTPGVRTVPVPCGGTRGVVTVPASTSGADVDLAVVTCPTDDRLVVLDLDGAAALGFVELPGRPTGIVREGSVVSVSTALDGRIHAFAVADLVEAVGAGKPQPGDEPLAVEATSARAVWTDGGRSASSLVALDAGPRGTLGAYQVVDNERRLSAAEIQAGSTYGTPKDGRARLEPAVAGACGARFSSLTDEARRLSGPVAIAAAPRGQLVWVVGEFSHSVSVVRCAGSDPSQPSTTVAAFDVGEGARGIVLSADGRRAYVDVGFDHEIAELRLPTAAAQVEAGDRIERQQPAAIGRRDVAVRHLSPLAQQGRRMFNDATDAHLTPFGVVTCGSCHPAAGDDGLSWRIEREDPDTRGIDRKVRRTPPAWLTDPTVKPLHWDGEFTSTDDLTLTTVQQLLGGDGLLVDTAAISAYLAEVGPPPDRPDASGGADVLADVGCTDCHAGEAGTDGQAHDVLAPSEVDDGDLPAVITPSLRAVRGRAPYGHDGRAPDLAALLAEHGDGDGGTIELTPDERAAVLAYLEGR